MKKHSQNGKWSDEIPVVIPLIGRDPYLLKIKRMDIHAFYNRLPRYVQVFVTAGGEAHITTVFHVQPETRNAKEYYYVHGEFNANDDCYGVMLRDRKDGWEVLRPHQSEAVDFILSILSNIAHTER